MTGRRPGGDAIAGFVEARACLDAVISTMLSEDSAMRDAGLADRMSARPGSCGRDVSDALVAAIEALDIAFEDWLGRTAAQAEVPDVGPLLRAVPAIRMAGGAVHPVVRELPAGNPDAPRTAPDPDVRDQ